MKTLLANLTLLLVILPQSLTAQERNTLTLEPGASSPVANLEDVQWLEGHWRGEAFGGITEELWSPPLGGSMMGAFKLVIDGEVDFYELVTISEENGSLILRLKHFYPDLKGWEEKNVTIDFPLVKVDRNRVYFSEFTIERISEREMNMYVVIGDGETREEATFNYHRVN